MSKVNSFEDLKCWQASRQLVFLVYSLSNTEKLTRDFGAKNQIRRAAVSVMNNIAEGFGRESHKEFVRFLDISHASCMEVKSMIYVFEDLGYLPSNTIRDVRSKIDETKALTRGLMKYLRENPKP